MKTLPRLIVLLVSMAMSMGMGSQPAAAQDKGAPGNFDFYLVDIAYGPDFCNVPGIVAPCTEPHGFVLHGLWPQNSNGTYPVTCSEEKNTVAPAKETDLTPNPGLVQHEWEKHGTCTAVGARRYFTMARKAYKTVRIPLSLAHVEQPLQTTPDNLLALFHTANPDLPANSIVLGCNAKKQFTAVAVCFTKSLKPTACENVHLCRETASLTVAPSPER